MAIFVSITSSLSAQKGAHHHPKAHRNHPHKRAVVYHSKHRPATIVVYHPHWAPKKDFHRRWVFFPVSRIYWDNWRQVYFYHNGRKWISVKTLPSHLAHLKLENEQHYELEETKDDDDEVYEHEEAKK